MTSKQVTALAIKILAIWLLAHVVLYLPSVSTLLINIEQFRENQIPASLSIALFAGFLTVGLMISLVMFRVSNSVLESVSKPVDQTSFSQSFALQIVGLFFIVSALAALPGFVITMTKQVSFSASIYGYIAGYAFKVAVGAYLLVKPEVWRSWFNTLRGRG